MNCPLKESCANCANTSSPIVRIYDLTPFPNSRYKKQTVFLDRVKTCNPPFPQAPDYDKYPNINCEIPEPNFTTCPGWRVRS